MKIGIVSDLHLGDPICKLVRNAEPTKTYGALRDRIRAFTGGSPLDFLVLNGDILDFSVSAFEDACEDATPIFRAIKADGLAQQLVYIPGNHDKQVWDAVEWETNVIRRLVAHKQARPFRRTQPAVIRWDTGTVELPGVSKVEGTDHYGTLFVEGLFKKGETLNINVAYPNLYIKTPAATYLVTHGHMLEAAWVLLSELLSAELPPELGLHDLEEHNIPLTAMICTGVGQAGAVSRLFSQIQREAKEGKADRLGKVLDGAIPRLDDLIRLPLYAEWVDNAVLRMLRRLAPAIVKKVKGARYDQQFFRRESVRERFLRFYAASCDEAEQLGLSVPSRVIFGHTHEPLPANSPMKVKGLPPLAGQTALLYNCGGWLEEKGKSAELFLFDDSGTLLSFNVK